MKTNKCQCSCRATDNDVGTIDVQVTYDADVPTAVYKANVRLVQANCRTEVRCVPSANSSLNKIVCDTYDSQAKRLFVFKFNLMDVSKFNMLILSQ